MVCLSLYVVSSVGGGGAIVMKTVVRDPRCTSFRIRCLKAFTAA